MKILYGLVSLILIYIHSFAQVPAISNLSPASGPIGSPVTITGSNFSATPSANIVYFGSVRATVTAASSNQLTVTVPSGSTYQPLTVTVNGLTAYSPEIFNTTFAGGGAIDPASFGALVSYSTGSGANRIAFGDLDGDGKTDIATTGFGGPVHIFRNNSSGSSIAYEPPVAFSIDARASQIAIGDLDGDGKLDLAVTCESLHEVYILRNVSTTGSITSTSFEPRIKFTTSLLPHDVSIGDLDSDGKPDLAVATQHGKVSVFRNTSTTGSLTTGSFSGPVDFAVTGQTQVIQTADLDADGKPEIVTASYDGNTISILKNTSTPGSITAGSFAAKVDFTTGSYPFSIAIADVDGDGKPDITVLNRDANTISIFQNVGTSGAITTSTFSPKVDLTTENNNQSVVAADIDGDGRPDLCVTATNALSIYRNVGPPGTLTASSFAPKIDLGPGISSFWRAVVGDLNNDGKPDLAFGGSNLNILTNVMDYPYISDFTPLRGEEGTAVTINGHDFDPVPANNIVKFNGTPATVVNGSSSTIEVTVPAGATNGYITVEVNGKKFQSPSIFVLPPKISSFTPSGGAIGTTVVISGTNFDPLTTNNVVKFNGTVADVRLSSATSITAIVPPGATSGVINLSVNSFTATSASAFTVKQSQSIAFDVVPNNITMGDLPLTLNATASSGLPVQFSSTSSKVGISGSQITLLAPGSVTITANQSGNDSYVAASPVSRTFCINPMKPQITIENPDNGLPILVSTSVTGNQWYYNGVAISGEKSQSFIATETGFYNVKVTVDNCVSQISDDLDVELTVTDVEGTQERKLILYPVPAHQSVSLKFDQYDEGSPVEILIYNNLSQPVVQKTLTGDQLDAPLDISSLPKGVYVLQAGQGNVRHQIKFVKEE